MKKIIVIIVVVFSITSLFPQGLDMVKGGAGFLGISLPFGDFGDSYNSGLQFGLSARSKTPGIEYIDTDFTIGFAKYKGEPNGIIKESEYTIIPLTVNGILGLNPMASDIGSGFNPYLVAGIGYYLLRDVGTMEWDDATYTYTLDYDESEGAAGINLGFGAMYFINKNIFLEGYAKYHYILREGDSISLMDIRLGTGFYF